MAQRGRPKKQQINTELDFNAKSDNSYEEAIMTYVEGFVTDLFSSGQIKTISEKDLQSYFASPDTYYKELSDLMTYYYISDGDIYQLYTLIQVLPTLNYKINVLEMKSQYKKNLLLCNKMMQKVKYKQLTRDLLSQECTNGTVVCTWIGDKKNPYLFVFDNLKYVFPKFRRQGEWVCIVDMAWFKTMKDEERNIYFNNLSPYVTEQDYNNYLGDTVKNRYIELPTDRTTCLRINTIYRNQRLGIPMGTQALFDKLHKQTLRNLEKSVCERVIKNIVVLKIGSKDNQEYSNMKLPRAVKQKITARVKQALTQNLEGKIPVISLPEYTDIDFNSIEGMDALKKDKFEGINNDISNAIGVSNALTNGTGANFASAKLNLDILYKRIGIMLEGIEEVYNKLFRLILPNAVKEDYNIEFDKATPLTVKEQLEVLQKLHSEGFAVKPIIDTLSGIDYQSYLNDSFYEIEKLGLRDRIIPPMSTYTMSGRDDDGIGRPIDDDSTNPNTVGSKENGGNDTPRAGV
jgi:hypothetical protein